MWVYVVTYMHKCLISGGGYLLCGSMSSHTICVSACFITQEGVSLSGSTSSHICISAYVSVGLSRHIFVYYHPRGGISRSVYVITYMFMCKCLSPRGGISMGVERCIFMWV